jgi:hypothetical protein
MIVLNLDIVRAVIMPTKYESELVVDSNRVLALALSLQFFETIAWNSREVTQRSSLV